MGKVVSKDSLLQIVIKDLLKRFNLLDRKSEENNFTQLEQIEEVKLKHELEKILGKYEAYYKDKDIIKETKNEFLLKYSIYKIFNIELINRFIKNNNVTNMELLINIVDNLNKLYVNIINEKTKVIDIDKENAYNIYDILLNCIKDNQSISISLGNISIRIDLSTVLINTLLVRINKDNFTDKLIKMNTLNSDMGDELIRYIKSKKNVMIIGNTCSGKTTLLNSLINNEQNSNESSTTSENIDRTVAVIRTKKELNISKRDYKEYYEFAFNGQGEINDFMPNFQLLISNINPEKMIIEEIFSHHFYYLLMNDIPYITTMYSLSPKDCFNNILSTNNLRNAPLFTKRSIADRLDIIVQIDRLKNGRRVVTKISQVIGYGNQGFKRNNEWVSENNLDKKFMLSCINDTELYVQDIYYYDFKTDNFVYTGWLPIEK